MSAVDTVIETVLIVFCWGIQIGITVAIALLLGWLLKKAESAVRRKPGHLLPWTVCTFAVLCAVLAALALNPPVVCPDEYEDNLTPEIREAVQSVSRGIYSRNIPLVPAYVEITKIQEWQIDNETVPDVYFVVHYLYSGRVGMSFMPGEGYNIEKPLCGLS